MLKLQSLLFCAIIILYLHKNISCLPTTNVLSDDKILVFKEIAKKIKDTKNANVDPCIDYNEYVCGNFDENKIVSKSEITTNERFDDEDLEQILMRFLPKSEDMNEVEKKMKDFLISCYNKNNQDIKEFIKNFNFQNAIGKWPALNRNWDERKFNLAAAVAEFELLANSILINTIFKEKDNKLAIKISPKRIFIPDDEDIQKETFQLREKMFIDYGVFNVEQVNNDVILFEKEYSDATLFDTIEESQEVDYKTLKQKLPEFDWDTYFNILLDTKLDDSTIVIVDNLQQLENLISKIQKMERRIVANYFFFLFVRRINVEFKNDNSCYDRLFLHFESVISKLVVKNLYTDTYKVYLFDMIHAVVDTLKESLTDFNGRTTEDIMGKITNFLENEYLPSLTYESVKDIYAKVEVDSTDFYGNIFRFFRHYMKVWLKSSVEGKNIGMKIINRRLISYIFIRAIYEYYRKPSPLVFDVIATPLLRRSLMMLAPKNNYDESVKECFQKQLNISQKLSYSDIVSVKAVEVYIRSFEKWAEKHPQIVASENELFSEFGLTDRRILFTVHVQSSCRYKETNDKSYLRKLFFSALPNMQVFADEYSCPIGSPMNPRERCEIP